MNHELFASDHNRPGNRPGNPLGAAARELEPVLLLPPQGPHGSGHGYLQRSSTDQPVALPNLHLPVRGADGAQGVLGGACVVASQDGLIKAWLFEVVTCPAGCGPTVKMDLYRQRLSMCFVCECLVLGKTRWSEGYAAYQHHMKQDLLGLTCCKRCGMVLEGSQFTWCSDCFYSLDGVEDLNASEIFLPEDRFGV